MRKVCFLLFGLIGAYTYAMESDGMMSPLDIVKIKSLKSRFEKSLLEATFLTDILARLIQAKSYDELIGILDELCLDQESQKLFPLITQPFEHGHVIFSVYSLFAADLWKQSKNGSQTLRLMAYLEQNKIGPTNGDRMLLDVSSIDR